MAGAPVPVVLSRDKQVAYVKTLLNRKGEPAATEIRRRIKWGQGVTVKGLTFDSDVLEEALRSWMLSRTNTDPAVAAAAAAGQKLNDFTAGCPDIAAGRPAVASAPTPNRSAAGGIDRDNVSVSAKEGIASRQLKRKKSEECSEDESCATAAQKARAVSPVRGTVPGRPGRLSLPSARGSTRKSAGASPTPAAPPTAHAAHAAPAAPWKISDAAGAAASAPPSRHTWELSFSPRKRRGTPATDLQEERENCKLGSAALDAAAKSGFTSAAQVRNTKSPAGLGRGPRQPASSAAWASATPSEPPRRSPRRCSAPAATPAYRPPHSEPAPEPEVSAPEVPEVAAKDLSVKELKGLLSGHSIDFAGAVEKSDLQALWQRFSTLRSKPLSELQAACRAQGGPSLGTAEGCARWLASPAAGASPRAAPNDATPGPAHVTAPPPAAEDGPSAMQREQAAKREDAAQTEVERILRFRRESFFSPAAWGFAVLSVAERTTTAVAKQ